MTSEPPNEGPWGTPGQWASDRPPPGAPAVGQEPTAPQSIRTAVLLMYVGAVLSLLGVPLGFMQSGDIRDQIREDNPDLTSDDLDMVVTMSVAFAVFMAVLGVALWIWMAVMNGRGRSWARVVASVFGGLNIAFTALGLVGGAAMGQAGSGAAMAMNLLSAGLAVVILVLLYQPPSSAYYDAVSRQSTGSGWSAY